MGFGLDVIQGHAIHTSSIAVTPKATAINSFRGFQRPWPTDSLLDLSDIQPLPTALFSLQDDFNTAHPMSLQAHIQPTPLASTAMALGPAPLAFVFADTVRELVRACAVFVTTNLNATSNLVVANAVSHINPTRVSVSCNTSSISAEIYSANGNTSVNALIEVERRGAERVAQVQTVTKSIRDLTTERTEARTPRTARPAFTRRPLFTMTSTTNTTIRRASGDSRSRH